MKFLSVTLAAFLTCCFLMPLNGQIILPGDDDPVETTTTETQTETSEENNDGNEEESQNTSNSEAKAFSAGLSLLFGAVTLNGENFQQIGLRPTFQIYKLGLGLDVHLLIDENGQVRKEDWDDALDYVDKIYFISWAKKGAPFYVRLGGLEYTYLGYDIMVNGYSNLVQYPTRKRLGMEMSFKIGDFGTELFINDYKELFEGKPAMLGGARLSYNIIGGLTAGVGVASDLNEYKGLYDDDGDGYADEIDRYPYDANLVTEIDRYRQAGIDETTITQLVNAGLLDGLDKSDLVRLDELKSTLTIYSADLGYNVFKTNLANLDIYTQFAQITETKGWGFTAPGLRFKFGWFTLTAEYKQSSDEFQFGYFNQTYELERAKYVRSGNTVTIVTKKDSLKNEEAKKGYYAKAAFNIFSFLTWDASYQDLFAEGSQRTRTLTSSLGINDKLIPKVSGIKGYYIQNNVDKFILRSPSTIMGALFSFKFTEGAVVNFNYQLTYEDRNGDGNINGSDETVKNIYITMTSPL